MEFTKLSQTTPTQNLHLTKASVSVEVTALLKHRRSCPQEQIPGNSSTNQVHEMRLRVLSSVLCFAICAFVSAAAQFIVPPRNFEPEQGNTVVAGTVYGPDGIFVSGARVELRDASNGMVVSFSTTQSNGTFAMYNIPLGNYEVVARTLDSEARETIPPGATINRVHLRLAPIAATAGTCNAPVSVVRLKIPGKARDRYNKAAQAFLRGKLDEADKAVNQSLAIYPDNPEALTLRGLIACRNQNASAAILDFQKSIDVDPNYMPAYTAMSSTFNSQGKYDDAARITEQAVAVNPNAWQGYFELAKAMLGKGLYQKALQVANKAETLAPSGIAGIHLLKAYALLPLKLYKEAGTELQAFLSHAPRGQDTSGVKVLLAKVQAAEATASGDPTAAPGFALVNH